MVDWGLGIAGRAGARKGANQEGSKPGRGECGKRKPGWRNRGRGNQGGRKLGRETSKGSNSSRMGIIRGGGQGKEEKKE